MSTWSGWIIQFLTRASVINTPPNQTFMSEWAKHAPGSCRNNPVDLSAQVGGSSRCGDTIAGFGRSQNYATHAEAAHAFSVQMHTAWVKPLLDALNTGNPFQIADRGPVIAVLKRWGSVTFADWYAQASSSGGSGGGGGGGGGGGSGGTKAPHTHHAWTDLRKSVNNRLPAAIRHSTTASNAAWRALGAGRKVH